MRLRLNRRMLSLRASCLSSPDGVARCLILLMICCMYPFVIDIKVLFGAMLEVLYSSSPALHDPGHTQMRSLLHNGRYKCLIRAVVYAIRPARIPDTASQSSC
ncbi:hypothetical protein OBBRIDRAFT_320200 [Obba rivulosa]|uniref:Uncharacterized protein n=1 Tax=Obba rivulosa TaxID=1052685 RepID=A0A8E2AIY8_9APHY|nr:hypothetical protein OBBRIDRAFT_320200 [Obba rivulosa]